MTSRELTGLLPLTERNADLPVGQQVSDWAWRLGFGFIGWPWLLRSLHGGRKADKQRLLDTLGLAPDALPHLGSWKADTGFLRHIVNTIARLRPTNVVELGAGASTLIAARALALHGGGQLTSFDQHAGFVKATQGWLADNGLSVDLRHAPLQAEGDDWPGRWYAVEGVPDRIDLIIIDGPPWSVHPLVRGAADRLFDRLAPGGMILLDDAARPGERLVARRWRKRWPDIDFTLRRDGTKGTLVGVKRGVAIAAPAPDLIPANDNGGALRHVARAAAMLGLIGAGWIAHDIAGDLTPEAQAQSFIDEAAASHRTGLLRLTMASQIESPHLDRGEITRSTGVRLPAIPRGWRISDVQLYPNAGSPAVALSLTTPQGEPVSLFADRAETAAEGKPLLARRAQENVAYWEEGDFAFALTGEVAASRALELAAALAAGNEGG